MRRDDGGIRRRSDRSGRSYRQYQGVDSRLAMLAAGAPGAKDTPKQLSQDVADYVKLIGSDEYHLPISENAGVALTGAEGIYDKIVSRCRPRVTVQIQQTIAPDPAKTFEAMARTNIFYTDGMQFGVDSNGFPTNGAPSSTAQLPTILASAASLAGMAIAPGGSDFIRGLNAVPNRVAYKIANYDYVVIFKKLKPAVTVACVATTVPTLDEQIADLGVCDLKKGDLAAAQSLASQIRLALMKSGKPGALKNLPASTLPQTFYAWLPDFDLANGTFKGAAAGDDHPIDTRSLAKNLNDVFGVALSMRCSTRDVAKNDPSEDKREDGRFENVAAKHTDKGVYDGIVVSATRSCQFWSTQTLSAAQTGDVDRSILTSMNNFWAQDSRYLTLLPTRRGFLVARSVTYTFSGGQATGVSDSRPSEASALFSLPGQSIGAFVGGVTSGVTDKQVFKTGQTSDYNAQAGYWNAQAAAYQAQAAAQKAKSGGN